MTESGITTWLTIGISVLALLLSGLTAWFTLIRRGAVRMTEPTMLFFGPDGGRRPGEPPRLKVLLRTLLYSTSHRGQTIESMHVSVSRAESKQNFSIWVYGDEHLARGSGLYIGPDGVACNHRFLLPEDGTGFKLVAGQYTVHVFAKHVRDRRPRCLSSVRVNLSDTQARQLDNEDAGIYFDWGPDQQAYHGHVEVRKPVRMPWVFEAPAG